MAENFDKIPRSFISRLLRMLRWWESGKNRIDAAPVPASVMLPPALYGVTDDALVAEGSCTVSIWKGGADTEENQEDVYACESLYALTLPAGVYVRIEYRPNMERWEIVEIPTLDGTLSGDLAAGDSATMALASPLSGNLTVYAPWVQGTSSIASGKKVTAGWNIQNQRWEVVGREC